MGLFNRIKTFFSEVTRIPSDPLDPYYYTNDLGSPSHTKILVTPDSALRASAVYACVRVLSETVASLPLSLYQKNVGGKGKRKAEDHPVYALLHDSPNYEMDTMQWTEFAVTSMCLRGNCYNIKEQNQNGQTTALWPVHPDIVEIKRTEDNRKVYRVYESGAYKWTNYAPDQILHVHLLSTDGDKGLSPIKQAMNAVGLSLATEEFGGKFFGNGITPSAVFQHPGVITETGHKNLKAELEEKYGGLRNASGAMLVEEGMEYKQISIKPEESQFLETRKFQISEIARIFRVPPHLIADLDKATFSNIEHQSLDFAIYTILPWLVRFEKAMNRSLLTAEERAAGYYTKFEMSGLLRGDTLSRFQAYAQARNWGWLCADDIRELEDMNPLPDGIGQIYLQPSNMIKAGEEPPAPSVPGPREEPEDDEQSAQAWKHELAERIGGNGNGNSKDRF